MIAKEKIHNLKELMNERNIDAYIIPSTDAHQSEYVANHWNSRKWISGFTGSAGTVIVTRNKGNGLWTDGRYFIQAEKQLEGTGIELFRMGQAGVPTISEWLKDNIDDYSTIGFDGSVVSKYFFDNIDKALVGKSIKYHQEDLIDLIWKDRDIIPEDEFEVFDVSFAGKSRVEKIDDVKKYLEKNKYTHFVLSSLDDIAWLLNIRGTDVPYNPVVISYCVVSNENTFLFVNNKKVKPEIKKELESDGIIIKEYTDLKEYLAGLDKNCIVTYDPAKTNMVIVEALKNTNKNENTNITTIMKAVKNNTEILNMKKSHIRDGVAMVKFMYWLSTHIGKDNITEITVADKLEELRSHGEYFKGISFTTIAGYKEHAAMMHYSATPESAYEIKKEGMLLIDSGAQYLDGTTDITRTLVMGEISDEEKRDFTLVLKGVIGLSTVKFLYGASGSDIDIMARAPLWRYGIDYKCGTGHGVGYYLNVHEGPQGIRPHNNAIVLEAGMNITNEPGVYKEGRHGIRTENVLIVKKDESTESGEFMSLETITYAPIDLNGVDKALLTNDEIAWLNSYHQNVYEKLSPYLDENEKQWLRYNTRAI